MRRRHGFTILELLVGLSVALIVLAAVVSLFSRTMQTQRRARARTELGRQGAFLGHLLQQELRLAGLGVPTATSVEGALPPVVHVLFAGSNALGIVADLPRPDATFSTFGVLDDRPAGVRRLMWHTDQNGACAPQAAGCPVNETSVLYRGDTALCTAAGDRTCPWANHRLRPGEYFVAAAGNGSWANLLADGSGDNASGLVMQTSVSPDGGGVRGLVVDAATNAAQARGWPATWTNTNRGDAPVDVRGQGFVSTPDRIFYRACGPLCPGGTGQTRVLERRQCWGPLLTTDAGWPPTAADADPAQLLNGTFDPATTPLTTCTPWEVAARDVVSVNFEYFAARSATSTSDNANRITGAARNRSGQPRIAAGFGRVDIAEMRYTIKLSRVVDGFTVGHDVVGTVRLRNR